MGTVARACCRRLMWHLHASLVYVVRQGSVPGRGPLASLISRSPGRARVGVGVRTGPKRISALGLAARKKSFRLTLTHAGNGRGGWRCGAAGAERVAGDRVWDGTGRVRTRAPGERRMLLYAQTQTLHAKVTGWQWQASYRTPLILLFGSAQTRTPATHANATDAPSTILVPGTREIPRALGQWQVLCLALCPGGFSLCMCAFLPANANPELGAATQGEQSHDRHGDV